MEDEHNVKVFYPDDQSLKKLGELLQNETSRKIIATLAQKEMYLNQLADYLNLRISLVIHHLDKIKELGLVETRVKPISRKTKDHNFYKIKTDVFLGITQTREENKLMHIFKSGIKFTVIGIVAASVFMITDLHHVYNPNQHSYATVFPEYVAPLSVLTIGLIIERILSRKKGKN